MLSKVKLSLRSINYRLYFALLFLGVVPTIYTTIRVFFVGQMPSEWSFSIAGQLAWVNLIYEILNEGIILPLFFFVGSEKSNRRELSNRISTGVIFTFLLYAIMAISVIIFAEPLLLVMATDTKILSASAEYIRIESIANIFSILSQYLLVVLISMNQSKYLYVLTGIRFVLCICIDTFLVSTLPFSMNLGVNGIGISNIVVNIIIFSISAWMLYKEGISILLKTTLDFSWLKQFFKVGAISGLESLVRNFAYMVMISRMINIVGEQGVYWVANNFIWSWLLLPVLQLGELIKKEVATDKKNIRKNTLGYISLTTIITLSWVVSIPLWKPFMSKVLGLGDVDKIFKLVLILTGFYVLFAFQNIFDSTFYGLGKTNYMLFESIVTNTIYYGTTFVLYITKIWTPTLMGIALLFGIGNAFDSLVSLMAYVYMLKKEKDKA